MTNFPTEKQIEDLFEDLYNKYSDSDVGDKLIQTLAVREALERWGTPEPTALEDGEPHHTDLDDYGSCWWWDEYDESWELLCGDMGGVAAIRKCNEMNDYPHHYTHWLPYWAIKTPEGKDD